MNKLLIGCLALLALASCESGELTTPNSQQTLERKLILNPDQLDGERYEQYTLRARVTNVSSSDLLFVWDLDEGRNFSDTGAIIKTVFYHNKVHNVRVRALDTFNDTLVAEATLRADIRPPVAFVEVMPSIFDTAVFTSLEGTVSIDHDLYIKASTPLNLTRTEWDFGDGLTFTSHGLTHITHTFSKPGTYRVIANVYDNEGIHLGIDSSLVTIRVTPPWTELISSAKNITVFLVTANTHPISTHPFFKDPFAVRFPASIPSGDTTASVSNSFGEKDFSMSYLYQTASPLKIKYDSLSCVFNDEFDEIKSAIISVNDTGLLQYPALFKYGLLKYRFILKDLELLVNSITSIVYTSKTLVLSDFLEEVAFTAENLVNHPTGSFTYSSPINVPTEVIAIIRIDR